MEQSERIQAGGVQILRRSIESQTAGQDRYQRSAHAGLRFFDVVLHALHQGRRISEATWSAQKLFVTRDLRLLAENLAKGKIAVTSGIGYSEFQPFIKANLPVVPLPVPKEGLYASGGYGHLVVLKNQPHPERDAEFSSTGCWAATVRRFLPAAWASARAAWTSTPSG